MKIPDPMIVRKDGVKIGAIINWKSNTVQILDEQGNPLEGRYTIQMTGTVVWHDELKYLKRMKNRVIKTKKVRR